MSRAGGNLNPWWGEGLPVPRGRTFAAGILPSAHSMLAALRHRGFAGQQGRLRSTGSPSQCS